MAKIQPNRFDLKPLLLTLVLLIFTGCTSLQEKAEEFLVEGSYTEAMATFEQILEKNGSNKEARIGLRKARLGWISKNLIQVRKLRLAGSIQESLDNLLEVIDNQEQWNLFPNGDVAFTQEEESAWARQALSRIVNVSLLRRQPLRAEYFLNHYQRFFQDQHSQKSFFEHKKKLLQLATNECRNKIRDLKSGQYFYGRFIERFCQHWGFPPPELSLLKKQFQAQAFSRVAVNTEEASGFPSTFALDLEARLQKKLRESPWFDPTSSRVLDLSFRGTYSYEHKTQPTILTHTYTVSVPYETTRIEREESPAKKESSVVSAFRLAGFILSAVAGDFGSERQRSNGDGTVTIYETHYRDEPRTTTYQALAHHETFSTEMVLQGRLNQSPLQVIRDEKGYSDTVSHQNDMRSIGLYPQAARLIGPEDWIQNERQHLTVEFGRTLKDSWRNQYCRLNHFNGSSPDHREQAFRCIELADSATPVGFQRWFKNEYGIGINAAVELLYHDPKYAL